MRLLSCSVPGCILIMCFYYATYAIMTNCFAVWSAEFANNLLQTAGPRFAGPISILRNWTFCVFYVMAELWGSVVVSLLFWGFGAPLLQIALHHTATLTVCRSAPISLNAHLAVSIESSSET